MKKAFIANVNYKRGQVSDKLSLAENIPPVFYLLVYLGHCYLQVA